MKHEAWPAAIRPHPYEITADALERAARFVAGMNALIAETGVSFDPSYGGVEVDQMMVGDLRCSGDRFVLNVAHS